VTRSADSVLYSLLACPGCLGRLTVEPGEAFVCSGCGGRFPAEGDIFSLVPPSRRPALDSFASRYRRARIEEGWHPLSRADCLALPEGAPEGYPPLYWPVRRQTYHALFALLDDTGREPAASPAADVGSGIGWLAYRLAQRGHPTLAMDGSLDADFGLGASTAYVSACRPRFLPVRADLDALPLRPGALELVVFNASLHYARDVGRTLQRAAAALAPGGRLLILDTPLYRQPRTRTDEGEKRLGLHQLVAELTAAGLDPRVRRVFRGLGWVAYQTRHVLRGRSPFTFPILIGSKPSRLGGAF